MHNPARGSIGGGPLSLDCIADLASERICSHGQAEGRSRKSSQKRASSLALRVGSIIRFEVSRRDMASSRPKRLSAASFDRE